MKSLISILALSLALAGCTARGRVTTSGGGGGPPPPPPSGGGPVANDTTGGRGSPDQQADNRSDRALDAASNWDKLGQRWVHGKADKNGVPGGDRGPYRAIKIVVENSAVEIYDIVVIFNNGEKFSPPVRHTFGPGTTSRVIDLPGGNRNIRAVNFAFGNLPGGGKAQVEVWALK